MRVLIVTTVELDGTGDDLDLPHLVRAFDRAGIELGNAAWEDDAVDWDAADLIVVRSTWNYVERESEFRSFLDRFRDDGRFHAPVPLIEWNLDKHYLRELSDLGIPVVPTAFVDRADDAAVAIATIPGEVVVKPTISAGSRLTGRFAAGDPAAAALARAILDDGRVAMVQPYLDEVDDSGEYAVIMIDGVVAHRCRKAQILDVGGTFTTGGYRELLTPAAADPELDIVALRTAATCRDLARSRGWLAPDEEILIGRYDLTRDGEGSPVLLEAELFEPALFLPTAPASADLLAEALRRRHRA